MLSLLIFCWGWVIQRNGGVDSINENLISNFYGATVTYRSFDTIIDDVSNVYPVKVLNTLCSSGMSPHKLVHIQNCPVILIRNPDPSAGLFNGTRFVCKRLWKI